jgi:hypothetical protein
MDGLSTGSLTLEWRIIKIVYPFYCNYLKIDYLCSRKMREGQTCSKSKIAYSVE